MFLDDFKGSLFGLRVKTKIGIGYIVGKEYGIERFLLSFPREFLNEEYLATNDHGGDKSPHIWLDKKDIYGIVDTVKSPEKEKQKVKCKVCGRIFVGVVAKDSDNNEIRPRKHEDQITKEICKGSYEKGNPI